MVSLQKLPARRTAPKTGRGRKAESLWRVQFLLGGKRPTLRLGRMSQTDAESAAAHIDHLVRCKQAEQPIKPETQAWLQSLARPLVAKLHKLDLCREFTNPTIAQFSKMFIDRKQCKESTKTNLRIAHRHLIDHFGRARRLSSIAPHDASAFSEWLTKQVKSQNTARRRLGRCRELFTYAVEQQVISSNPFKQRSLPVAVGAADKRYVPASDIRRVIDYIPPDKTEWRLLLAFGRFLGVRMPSEIRQLTWEHVNWEENKIVITAPKTEHQGKPSRSVPIFVGLYPLLRAQFEKHESGLWVFPALRKVTNPATTAAKYVERAGLATWPKFWNSLRASCETDLMDMYGVRRSCTWLGNTPAVAFRNYSLIRGGDFLEEKSDVKSDDIWANLPQSSGVTALKNPAKPMILQGQVTPMGLERLQSLLAEETAKSESDVKSDVVSVQLVVSKERVGRG